MARRDEIVDALRLAKERAVEQENDEDLAVFRSAEKAALIQRQALGKAWGAFLMTITPEMWEDIRAFSPDTVRRLRQALRV